MVSLMNFLGLWFAEAALPNICEDLKRRAGEKVSSSANAPVPDYYQGVPAWLPWLVIVISLTPQSFRPCGCSICLPGESGITSLVDIILFMCDFESPYVGRQPSRQLGQN